MNRLRYNYDMTIGAGVDSLGNACSLPVRMSIDVVDYPYGTEPTIVDSTTLAPCGVEISNWGLSTSSKDVPAQSDMAAVNVKIYDVAGAAGGILRTGNPPNKRLQLTLWRNTGSGYRRYFMGCIDKTSIVTRYKVNTTLGSDAEITLTAGGLEKTALQDITATACQQLLLTIVTENSLPPVSGGFQIGVYYNNGGGLSAFIPYNASPAAVLTALQATPVYGSYFIACYNAGDPNLYPTFNITGSPGYSILVDTASLYADHGINYLPTLSYDSGAGGDWIAAPSSLNTMRDSSGGIPLPWLTPPTTGTQATSANFVNCFPTLQPSYHLVNAFYIAYQIWYIKAYGAGNPTLTQYPGWWDWSFTTYNDLITAVATMVAAATDLPAAAPNIDLTHIGVTVHIPNTGTPTNPTTILWGAGAGDSLHQNNLHKVLAFNKHTFVDFSDPTSDREYNLTKQSTLYDVLKILCELTLCENWITFDETAGVYLNVKSPLSSNVTPIFTGNPTLTAKEDTRSITEYAFDVNEVNVGIKKAQFITIAVQNDDGGNPYANLVNPSISVASEHDGSGVGGDSILCTLWIDNGTAAPWTPYAENLVEILDDPATPSVAYSADYSMFDFTSAANPNPNYPFNLPFTINQGWGGGALNGGSVVTASAAHWQQMMVLGLQSLFCRGTNASGLYGAQLLELEVPLTMAQLDAVLNAPLLGSINVLSNDGNTYNWLVLGMETNAYTIDEGAWICKFTAIKNYNG